MKNIRWRRIAAALVSGSMLMGAAAVGIQYQNIQAYAEEADENKVSLNIAGRSDEAETEAETQDQTEAQTEPKVEYDQLETTITGEGLVAAVDVSAVVENNMPSIVAITETSVQEVESYFYGKQEIETQGAGSGIIIAQNDSELLIVTNNHVAEGATDLTVCFSVEADDPDDLLASAVVKGLDSENDLAVIAVKLGDIKENVFKQLKVATLGSSKSLKVGETAIVIGNALGTGQTVTTGIISALERKINTEAGTFTEFQTDAAINLGCSGGAILNGKGEVIGITNAKETAAYAEAMGYGIPIDTAIPILENLVNRETREKVDSHGYLGITVVPVSDEAKQMYNMPAGAFVYEVGEGSAAEKAGIHKGDIVTRFDGIAIASSDALVDRLAYYSAGETVTVTLQSNENGSYKVREVEVTLQEGTSTTVDDKTEDKEDKKDEQDDQTVPDEDSFRDYRTQPDEDDWGGFGGLGDIGDFFFGRGF